MRNKWLTLLTLLVNAGCVCAPAPRKTKPVVGEPGKYYDSPVLCPEGTTPMTYTSDPLKYGSMEGWS